MICVKMVTLHPILATLLAPAPQNFTVFIWCIHVYMNNSVRWCMVCFHKIKPILQHCLQSNIFSLYFLRCATSVGGNIYWLEMYLKHNVWQSTFINLSTAYDWDLKIFFSLSAVKKCLPLGMKLYSYRMWGIASLKKAVCFIFFSSS